MTRDLRPLYAALASFAGGTGLTILGIAALRLLSGDDTNYRHNGFLDGILIWMLYAVLLFMSGSYLGAVAWWSTSRRERDFSPAAVAAGLFCGGLVASMACGLLGMLLPYQLVGLIQPVASLGACLGGAYWAGLWWRPAPASALRRAAHGLLVLPVLLVVGGLALAPRHDFPGGEAPLQDRDAWARKTFPQAYPPTVEMLRGSQELQAKLGKVEGIGPMEGPNFTSTSPGEVMSEFTLELIGSKGKAVCHMRGMSSGQGWEVGGKVKLPDGSELELQREKP